MVNSVDGENELADIVWAKDPSVVFLVETWVHEARLKNVLRKIKFENFFFVPRTSKGGGLVLFWRTTIDVTVEGSGKNYIDAIINKDQENGWRFTGFYGEPVIERRLECWNLLRSLDQKFQIPWLCVEDFNELIRGNEKREGNRRSHNQMQLFQDAINECGFFDLGYMDLKFTWRKHYASGQSIWERLDIALCTNDWLQQFGDTKVHHLNCITSDHVPLWIVLNGFDPPLISKPFTFEEIWLTDMGCD
ncbi:uncharacterized protein LOC142608912 [Castanea sativa]|uniref:uncharacterized protein LOC142608912 n=1 Tax=Castanea sativa TaxID=21020 RepID=UPI003F64FAB8